jgi:hypothetical protein
LVKNDFWRFRLFVSRSLKCVSTASSLLPVLVHVGIAMS